MGVNNCGRRDNPMVRVGAGARFPARPSCGLSLAKGPNGPLQGLEPVQSWRPPHAGRNFRGATLRETGVERRNWGE
eukprot:2645162-Alexandrium_andersonii.AAC.1